MTHAASPSPLCVQSCLYVYNQGEILTATMSKEVKILAVYHKTFVAPTREDLDDLGRYLDISSCNLMEYGMSMDAIKQAYLKFLSLETHSVVVDSEKQGSHRLDETAEVCLGISFDKQSAMHSSYLPVPTQAGMVVLSCDTSDDEAVASMCILKTKVYQDVDRLVEEGMCMLCDCDEGDTFRLKALVESARAVAVVLSRDTLRRIPQIITIIMGMGTQRTQMIPITLPGFHFPGDEYYIKALPVSPCQFPLFVLSPLTQRGLVQQAISILSDVF